MCDRLQPHQLDYDWRFTLQTAHNLGSLLKGHASLFLGCPSVAEALGAKGKGSVLIDRQPAVTCKFAGQVFQADVRSETVLSSDAKFERIMFDSPWYPDDVMLWLDVALTHSDVGSEIYFTLWPNSTRPTAALEAEALLNEASLRGNLSRIDRALRYETPGFEHISTVGVGNEWRTGDLVRLTVENPSPFRVSKPPLRLSWRRFAFGSYQIALRSPDRGNQSPSISPIYRSWHLPSVSRRQADLDKIQIWTSDNRVGSVSGGKHLGRALHALVQQEETTLRDSDREALQVLRDGGFLPSKLPSRRIEWEQFD